jgi:hypothetical protein
VEEVLGGGGATMGGSARWERERENIETEKD